MKLPIKIIMPVLIISLCLACASSRTLEQSFSSIQDGMSRENVKGIMGKPERSDTGALPKRPFFGPQESLTQFLKPGDPYEEWQYSDRETIYLIWFGSVSHGPQEIWKVITKSSHPRGAVF
ncbi:MAG: hypothetical protein AABY87_09480 [bacterium]